MQEAPDMVGILTVHIVETPMMLLTCARFSFKSGNTSGSKTSVCPTRQTQPKGSATLSAAGKALSILRYLYSCCRTAEYAPSAPTRMSP